MSGKLAAPMTSDAMEMGADANSIAELRHVSASYGKRPVLVDVSLTLRSSEIFVLMGPNGAGKTTLVRVLLGHLKPNEGTLVRARANPADSTAACLVPQDIALFPFLTARENCVAFAKMAGASWSDAASLADRAIELSGCKHVASTRVGGLSGGYRRRVNIAVALVGNPRLLILDEPTVGVDAEAKALIAETISTLKQAGMSILIVTHDFDDADALADRVGFLFQGRLALVGTPHDLLPAAFGIKKRIEIVLSSPPDHIGQERLRQLGASPSRSATIWDTFQELDSGHAAYISHLNEVGLAIKEIRISDPGLGALYRQIGGAR